MSRYKNISNFSWFCGIGIVCHTFLKSGHKVFFKLIPILVAIGIFSSIKNNRRLNANFVNNNAIITRGRSVACKRYIFLSWLICCFTNKPHDYFCCFSRKKRRGKSLNTGGNSTSLFERADKIFFVETVKRNKDLSGFNKSDILLRTKGLIVISLQDSFFKGKTNKRSSRTCG